MSRKAGQSFLRRAIGMLGAAGMAVAATILAASPAAAKRVALVIGNSAYEHAGQLANPANDAADMSAALEKLGFTVVTGSDLDNRGMRAKLREFSQELRGAEAAMVFYAGHAVQVNGENYLAPIDTKLEYESDVDFETISLEFILKQMEREVETILVFLDACRDNPISRSLKTGSRSNGAGKGLAETKLSAAGTFLAFATDPGNVALDGRGRNSPFTKALLANIGRPGVEVSTMMTDVRVAVRQETNGQQTPWTNSSLLGHFYFNPQQAAEQVAALDTASQPAAPAAPAQSAPASSTKVDEARVAALAWESVQDSDNEAALEFFIATYGDTFYGGLAKIRLERIRAEKAKAAEAAKPAEQPAQTAEQTKAEEKPAETAKAEEKPAAAVEAKPAEPAAEEQKVAALTPKAEESVRNIAPAFDAREVARDIQQRLSDLGCNPGRPDGLWGGRSGKALESFRREAKVKLVSVDPNPDLLDQLRGYKGRGCTPPAPTCSSREQLVGGRCVAKTCPEGQSLSSKGNCFTPRKEAKAEPAPEPRQKKRVVREQPVQQQVVEPRRQRVIVQQEPVIVEQRQQVIVQPEPVPQVRPHPGLGIGVSIGACLLVGC